MTQKGRGQGGIVGEKRKEKRRKKREQEKQGIKVEGNKALVAYL